MEKIIKIDIKDEENLLEPYNRDVVNHKLIEYIIKKSFYINKNEKIKIIIHNECHTEMNIRELILEGLKFQYGNILKDTQRKNIIQILLLLIGITLLFLSSLITERFIWKEVLIIAGWVPIWEMVDIELFKDFKSKKTKKIIQKLIKSEYVII